MTGACFINPFQAGRRGPQGLKPVFFFVLNGTAEAVPYPKPIYETRSKHFRFSGSNFSRLEELGARANARRAACKSSVVTTPYFRKE